MDVHKLATSEAIRALAQFVRRHFGLWVGLLSPNGDSVAVGSSADSPTPPVCAGFRARIGSLGSCGRSVRQWGTSLTSPNTAITLSTCHAGLSALVRPITFENRIRFGVYVSGFTTESQRGQLAAHLGQRARTLGVSTEQNPAVRVLSKAELAVLESVVESLCQEVEHELGSQLRPDSSPRNVDHFTEIIGQSAPMLAMFQTLERIGRSEATVLVQGENGTGKELLARAVHYGSPRADRAFVVQNCSALNDALLDSELFGHKRGSFTGAVIDKVGLFDLADGGTFFLDEVGDMSPVLQVRLLRVLQEGTFVPVGDTITHKVDVRIIAATNRDLKRMVAEGTFREDLFYRLNVINLVSPPLRERREDIPLLVDHFIARSAQKLAVGPRKISDGAMQRMLAHNWPGNIRELENEVERLVVLAGDDGVIDASLLSSRIRGEAGDHVIASDLQSAVETLERRMILNSLERCRWNKSHAAIDLGVSRRNLIRKVAKYDLERQRPKS